MLSDFFAIRNTLARRPARTSTYSHSPLVQRCHDERLQRLRRSNFVAIHCKSTRLKQW